MPPRRRTSKRRGPLLGSFGLLFLNDDGVHPLLDPCPDDPRYTEEEAREVWQLVRTTVWRHELRSLWPPMGATVYDNVTELTLKWRPQSPWREHGWDDARQCYGPIGDLIIWTPDAVRQAVESDVASVEAFRNANRTAAAEIVDELDRYVADLRVLESIATEHAHDLDVALHKWMQVEESRRPR